MPLITLSYQLCLPGFVHAGISSAADALEWVLARNAPTARANVAGWGEVRAHLVPVTFTPSRYVLFPVGDWTVILGNSRSDGGGGDLGPLTKRLGTEGAYAVMLEEARQWHVFRSGQPVRGVNAQKDGARWIFAARGPEEPYERLAQYEMRSKRDKVTVELVREYIKALTGIDYPPAWPELDWSSAVGFVHTPPGLREFPTVDDL